MDINKINPWIAGITLVFAGSLVIYFETYRNSQIIDTLAYLTLFGGWIVLFIKATKGTSVDAEKVLFKDDKGGWFKQRASNLVYYIIILGLIFGNGYYATIMAHNRKRDILADKPTKTTIATIDHIEVRKGRSSTSYYAVFQYTVNGKLVNHPWYEQNESDFLVGDKYTIQYSVQYPEMFMITEKLP